MFEAVFDRTLTLADNQVKIGKQFKSNEHEEHIAIVSDPGSKYIEYIAPDRGKARDICKEILGLLPETDSIDSLLRIGCDDCATNTGKKGGVVI